MAIRKKTDYISFADGVEGEIVESSIKDGMWKMKISVPISIINELRETSRLKEGEVKETESTLWVEVPEHLIIRAGHLMSNPIFWGFCDFRGVFVGSMPMASNITHHDLIETLRERIDRREKRINELEKDLHEALGDVARFMKRKSAMEAPIREEVIKATERGIPFFQKVRRKK